MAVDFNFDEYPTLLAVANSPAVFNVVVGPAGSAKTSAMLVLLLKEAMAQRPDAMGVRRTRSVIARQTYAQMTKTTVPSAQTMLRGVADVTDGKPPAGHASFPLPDGTRVEWEIVFLALDGPNVRGDILGLEATNAFIDELSEISDDSLVLALLSRLGRFPSAKDGGATRDVAFGSTNGPRKNHWLYEWHTGAKDAEFKTIEDNTGGRPYFAFFQQPPGLVKNTQGVWEPNPLAENIKNLPGGYAYYFRQLIRPPQEIQAYVEGRFADLQFGKVVYPQFNHTLHVIPEAQFRQAWSVTGRIMLSFDWGRTPVCLVLAVKATGGLVVIDEIVGEDISIDVLMQESVLPTLRTKYARCVVQAAYGDPAGVDKTQANELSPFEVVQAAGVDVQTPLGTRKDALAPRIEATRQRLQRLDTKGAPMLQITSNCKLLIDAMMGGYIFEEVRGQRDAYKEAPTKSHVNWVSDLANALEYVCLAEQASLAPAIPGPPKLRAPALLGG